MAGKTTDHGPLQVHQFPCLSDNYGYLVHDPATRESACIDTPDVAAIEEALARTGWRLTQIWNTHHHADHAGGNVELVEKTGCTVVGPKADAARIPAISVQVGDGDRAVLGEQIAEVFDTPGHTRGHIVYHFNAAGIAFVGDTLFAMGCGRLFEGSPEQMWDSLQKILRWPDETVIYCAHEYTQANARFAMSVDGGNDALVARVRAVDDARSRGEWTVPTTLRLEKATNPFLRPTDAGLRTQLEMLTASDVEVFAETRRRKDNF